MRLRVRRRLWRAMPVAAVIVCVGHFNRLCSQPNDVDLSGQVTVVTYDATCQQTVPGDLWLSNVQIQFSNTSLSTLAAAGGTITGSATYTYYEVLLANYQETPSGGIAPGTCQYSTSSYPESDDAILTVSAGGSGTLQFGNFGAVTLQVKITSNSVSGTTFVTGPSAGSNPSDTETFTVALSVSGSGSLQFTTAPNLPQATAGAFYTQALDVSGANSTVTYQITEGNADGLTLNSGNQNGVFISGDPSAPGTYSFTVVATEACGGCSASQTFNLNVVSTPLQFTTSANLPAATINQAYSVALMVNGATGALSFQLTQGSTLPSGLNLDPSSGVISGTPSEQGSFSFTVVATDSGTGLSTSQTFNLNIGAGGPLTIIGPTDFGLIVPNSSTSGVQAQVSITNPFPSFYQAQGGSGRYHWGPLPQPFFGLSFTCDDAAGTCTLGGTPVFATEPNNNVFFAPLIVKDTESNETAKITVEGELQIPNPPAPMVGTGRPINDTAIFGLEYLFTDFTAGIIGGRGIFSCEPAPAITQAGLTLSAYGGNCDVFGYPTAKSGTYIFTVNITDATGQGPAPVTLAVTVSPCSVPGNPGTPSNNCGPPTIVPDTVTRRPSNRVSHGFASSTHRNIARPADSSTPSINPGGIVDAAAYQPQLTPGGIMSIFGTNMAGGVYAASSIPLPSSLGNVQVTVNGENAPLFYVSPTQINFQAPLNPLVYYATNPSCLASGIDPATFEPVNCPSPGPATVMVISSGDPIGAVSVPVSTNAPAVLTFPNGAAIATHLNFQEITSSSPAQAGESIVLFGIDIGYPTCIVTDGFPSPGGCLTNNAPQFTFPDYPSLNDSAALLFAGLTPGSVALAQFNLQLPASLPSAAMAAGSIRMRIGDPTTGQTFNIYLAGASSSVPAITSLSPPSATAGGSQFTLTVNGSNFVSGAQVEWNGAVLPTNFMSSSQLTATVGANLIASPGTASITVLSQGQTSSAVSFPITAFTNACAAFPAGLVPFNSVDYVSAADGAGDRLLVGNVSGNLATIQGLPLPTSTNQEFCGQVNLGGGYNVVAYVPTSAERDGNFSAFAGLLIDPASDAPFPGGIIPVDRLGSVYAWRIPAQSLQGGGGGSASGGYQLLPFPATNNIQSGLISTFPTGMFTANNSLGTPFNISSMPGTCGPPGNGPCNFYDGFGSSGNGQSITINVSIDSPTDIYTLMNAYSPPAGVQIATIQFVGTGGASATFPLIGGQDIRDYYQGGFTNTLSNGVAGVEALSAFSCSDPGTCLGSGGTGNVQTGFSGSYVLDEQHFSLGTAFAGQTLTQIIITDTNNGSNPILMGITAKTANASPSVPNLGTGEIAAGGRDSAFDIVADTTGETQAPAQAYVVTSLAGGWTAIPGAAWIAPAADQSNNTRNGCCTSTSDTYEVQFAVLGNPASLVLNVTLAADDYVDVRLNGNTVFTHPNTSMWGTPVSFSISSGIIGGTNTLDFVVTNANGPTGLIALIAPDAQ